MWKYTETLTWRPNNAKRTLRFVFFFHPVYLSVIIIIFDLLLSCNKQNWIFSVFFLTFFFVVQDFPDFPDEDTENSLNSNVSRLCQCY